MTAETTLIEMQVAQNMSLIMARVSTPGLRHAGYIEECLARDVLHCHRRYTELLGDHPDARTAGDSQCLTDALRQLRRQGRPTRCRTEI